jgi:hypothetical protein
VPAYEVAHRSIFSGRLVDDAVSVSSWGTWWGGAANYACPGSGLIDAVSVSSWGTYLR